MDVIREVASHEGCHFLDPVVRREEGAKADGAVEYPVQLLDVGHALGLGEREELSVQQKLRLFQLLRLRG
jgi:hypothetical protein